MPDSAIIEGETSDGQCDTDDAALGEASGSAAQTVGDGTTHGDDKGDGAAADDGEVERVASS